MKHIQLRFVTFVVAALGTAATGLATNTRTWVGSNGVDSSTCGTPTAPCKTVQQAVTVTSVGGEVDVLAPMNDFGFTVGKALTIDGGNFLHIQVGNTGSPGILVEAGASDRVQLRNLSINFLPPASGMAAIYWSSGAALEVENVSISDPGYGITATASTGTTGSGPYLYAKNVTIRDATYGGMNLFGNGASLMRAVLDEVTVINTPNGITFGTGQMVATHCTLVNVGYGFYAVPSSQVDVVNSTVTLSTGYALYADGTGATIRIAGNSITDNSAGIVAANGGQILSFGTNRIADNYPDLPLSGTLPLQ